MAGLSVRIAAIALVTGLALALLVPAYASPASRIGGKYCGTALSGGKLVEVHTTLTMQPDGLLTGTYVFADDQADDGDSTPGDIAESMVQSDLTRTLVWRDKYGTGLATFHFDETGTTFTGFWGVGLNTPGFQWDGKRCDGPSV